MRSGENLVYRLVPTVDPAMTRKGEYARFTRGKTVCFVCHDEADEAKIATELAKGLYIADH